MVGAWHQLAPAVTMQEARDCAAMNSVLHLGFKCPLNFARSSNFPEFGSAEKGREKGDALL